MKAQFHIHIKGDPVHDLPYDWEDLVDHAHSLQYKILSVTCHNKLLFNKTAQKYAEKKDILLIPGIEIEIGHKHVLIINAHKDAEKIIKIEDLANYRENHPESFIVAPHPFFPGKVAMGKKFLTKNLHLFDAIEYSYYVVPLLNFNKKAIRLAEKHDLPLIATSDCHVLKYLDQGYTNLKLPRKSKPTTEAVLQALKQKNFTIKSRPIGYHTAARIILETIFRNLTMVIKKFWYNNSICTHSSKKFVPQLKKIRKE
jgi:predicted metal-dependent phosphoesterase TrpH